MRPHMLIAYNAAGNVVATCDYRVIYDESKPERPPLGLVDFAAHEAAGGEMTDLWTSEQVGPVRVSPRSVQCPGGMIHERAATPVPCPGGEWRTPAKGSKVWPEWIGGRAHDFRVELDGPPGKKHIAALIHKTSGLRRDRAELETAIEERIRKAGDEPADLRDLVGGPNRALRLDDNGQSLPWASLEEEVAARPALPLIGVEANS